MRYLLDTNIVLRVADSASSQHLLAAGAIAKLLSQNDDTYVAPQVLAEFWVVASRPVDVNGLGWPVDDVELAMSNILKKFRMLDETPQLFLEWHRLVATYRTIGKQAHDARLVAIMNLHGLTHLLTFNVNNFCAYPATVVAPDEILAR